MKLLSLILFLLCSQINNCFSPAGNLDSTFGINGKVITAISNAHANAMALQSDGKIVLAGYSSQGFTIARYNTDGSLDSTFGGDGIVTRLDPYSSGATSVAIQANGKILVVGPGNYETPIIRYNVNGSIDSSFGTNGIRYLDYPYLSLAIQPDSKIILVGTVDEGGFPFHDYDIVLARIDSNGLNDNTSFLTLNDFDDYNAFAYAVALQPDGKIVIAGRTDSDNIFQGYFAIARFNYNGTPDNSFGINGHVTTSLNDASGASGVAIQSDGKIVAVGGPLFTVARYNTDGSLDISFNGIGLVTTAIGSNNWANNVAIQSDGKIVVAGTSHIGDLRFAVARYNSNGSLDNSFGGGIITTDFGTDASGNAVAIQSDGKILVAGGETEFCMARYLPGLEVGVLNFESTNLPTLIYPNPIQSQATLQYSLTQEEILSICLYNTAGANVQTFFTREIRSVGEHQEQLHLDEALPAGEYILSISNGVHSQSVKITKQ